METIYKILNWDFAILVYLLLAIGSFIPTLVAILSKVKLNPDGKGYDDSPFFEDSDRDRLVQHYSRINGTLGYWKKPS